MRRTATAPHVPRRLVSMSAAGLVVLLALVGCGDDDDSVADVPASSGPSSPDTAGPTEPTEVPTTASGPDAGEGIDHPTDPDDVVVSIGFEGGFVPVGTDFVGAPILLVAGDGTAIVSGPQIAIFPGPLLPNLQRAPLGEPQVQELLGRADELGLLNEVEYARNDMVADASDTVVRISADGETFEHRAYALGLDGAESDPARANLQEFVDTATALANEVSAESSTAYESDAFLIQARPTTSAELGSDVEPTVVPWPADASVRLADAAECAEVPWDEGQPLFAAANQITLFDDGGTTYQLAAVPRLPGRTC